MYVLMGILVAELRTSGIGHCFPLMNVADVSVITQHPWWHLYDGQDLHFTALLTCNNALLISQPGCDYSSSTFGHKKSFLEIISMRLKCYLLICIGLSLSILYSLITFQPGWVILWRIPSTFACILPQGLETSSLTL
jgi:hypothetical protein